jgi:hypothetical protein
VPIPVKGHSGFKKTKGDKLQWQIFGKAIGAIFCMAGFRKIRDTENLSLVMNRC